MTADGVGPRIPTDQQLADILRFVARTCLEVERGLRPPAHLGPLIDPAQRWAHPDKLGSFRGGPVQDDHIGQPQVSRLSDSHIVATIITRTEADHWGALSFELRAHGGRWRLVDLHRLLASAHYRTPPAATVALGIPPEDLLAHIAEARRMASAAHQASSRRLADLTPGALGYHAARDMVRHWQRRLVELDRQLADVRSRQEAPERVEQVLRR